MDKSSRIPSVDLGGERGWIGSWLCMTGVMSCMSSSRALDWRQAKIIPPLEGRMSIAIDEMQWADFERYVIAVPPNLYSNYACILCPCS